MLIFESLKKKEINKKYIESLCELKNSFWKFGLQSNKKWFLENVKTDDLNLFLKKNKDLIGYTLLRKRTFKQNEKKKYFFYLDTLITSKKIRNRGYGQLLLAYNNFIIKQNRLTGFLLCKKKNIDFYRKMGWKLISKNKFRILNKKIKNLYGLIFNEKKSSQIYEFKI